MQGAFSRLSKALGKTLGIALPALSLGLAATAASAQPVVSFDTAGDPVEVEEGDAANLVITVDPAPTGDLTVNYRIGDDGDSATDDANSDDYTDPGGGSVTIEANAVMAMIPITITPDDDIDPTRESFVVSLESSGAGYSVNPSSPNALVVIKEGICDRTASVVTAIRRGISVMNCADVDDEVLRGSNRNLEVELTEIGGHVVNLRQGDFWGLLSTRGLIVSTPREVISGDLISGLSLSPNMFQGLSGLHELMLNWNVITTIPEGVFSGLGNLLRLQVRGNTMTALTGKPFLGLRNLATLSLSDNRQLTTLSSDVFSGLTRSGGVSLNFRRTGLTSLPPNLFLGVIVGTLTLPDTAPLPLRFVAVDDPEVSGSEQLKVVLAPGAPFDFSISLRTVNATLSLDPARVSIPRGGTQSVTFGVERDNPDEEGSVRFGTPPPPPFQTQTRSDFRYDASDTFLLVDRVMPLRVTIASAPDEGSFYEAGEKIIAEVTFSGDVHVSTATGSPTLELGIGDVVRGMHLAGTRTDTLIFEYTVSDRDYDADGISIGRGALMLGGAVINTASGDPVLRGLGALEIMNAPSHRVVGRRLSLSLGLQTESVVAGSFATATLRLVGSELLDEDDDTVAVSLMPTVGLGAPGMVTLERESFSTRFRVSVQHDAPFNLSTLTASVARNVQDLIAARVASAALSVRIAPRVFSLSFVPPAVTVTAGEASTSVELRLEEETGFLTETEMMAVSLAQMGVDITLNPAAVSFAHDRKARTIQVGAGAAAMLGVQNVRAEDSAPQLNTQISEANLRVTVLSREISVLFEPSGIRLVRGGLAAEATSEAVILRAESGLRGADEVVVDLSATGGLRVTPEEVRLNLANSTAEVVVEADADSRAGEVSATLDEGESSFGSAFVTAQPLTVELVRRVGLTLSGHGGSDMATIIAGGSTDVTVATSPPLEADEEARVTVNVASGLALIGDNRLILTGESPSATVRISTQDPELDLAEGVSSSGTGVNVELVAGAPLRVGSVPAAEVEVALSPRLLGVQQGDGATFRVTTEPGLAEGQSATVQLTMDQAGAGLSFADDSFSMTIALAGGAAQSGAVDVAVKASPDAMIGGTAQVTSTVEDFAGARVNVGGQSRMTLSVVTPRVTVGFTPAGGELGETLTLNLGTDRGVTLSLTDFVLSGNQTAMFRVSVAGEGLTLQGGATSLDLSLTAAQMTAEVTVSASGTAQSVGRLEARAIGGVELAGERQAAVLPIEVLQAVTLRFDPEDVLIERGRSAEFMVTMTPALIADRAATVTLGVPESAGFRFARDSMRHQVVLTPGKAAETVSVSATAEINSTIAVSVGVDASVGVDLGSLPSLELKVVTPRVSVTFTPADIEAAQGGTAAFMVTLTPALTAGQSATVTLMAPGGLSFSGSSSLTLPFDGEETTQHEVEISVDADAQVGVVEITSALEAVGFNPAEFQPSLQVSVSPASGQGAKLRIRVFLEGALE